MAGVGVADAGVADVGVAGQVAMLTLLLLVVEIFHEKEEENSSPTPKLDARLSSDEQVWRVRPASWPEGLGPQSADSLLGYRQAYWLNRIPTKRVF